MQSAECRIQKRRRTSVRVAVIFILHFAFCILHSHANELTVDKSTLLLTDTLTITLTLTDNFASLDNVRLPMQNLVVDGEPSTSTQFEWVNGKTFRRKVLRYVAHAR